MAKITMTFTGQKEDINELIDNLFESSTAGTRSEKELPEGVTITHGRMLMRKALGIPQALEIIISAVGTVAANVASSYIYDKLKRHKGGKVEMIINRREVHLHEGEITRVIQEEIMISDRDE
jgi:hypothetical protein